MSIIYPEIFDKNRASVFQKLANFKKLGVLSGGTAIALQIKHRKSFDFDIFIEEKTSQNLRGEIKETFAGGYQVILDREFQLDISLPQNIKLTFLYYPYSPLHPLLETDPINLFALEDLASSKALTIGRRGTWRDYVDLYFLLKEKHVNLEHLIKEAKKRFGGDFNERLFLEQLVYTGDISEFGIDFLRNPVEPKEVINFFTALVKKRVIV